MQGSSGLRRPRRPGSLVPVPYVVDVLVAPMAFVVGGQASRIQRSLRTETRNLEIQNGEDVDVQRTPDRGYLLLDGDGFYNWKTVVE